MPDMRVDLHVPYAQKDEARRLGARWDPAKRVWYLTDPERVGPFLKWMPPHLLRPHQPDKHCHMAAFVRKRRRGVA